MTVAASGALHLSVRAEITSALIALAVLVPLGLRAARRLGDLVPVLIILGTAAFTVYVLPAFPHAPVACLATRQGCTTDPELNWVIGLAFLLPVGLAVAYKTLRGDKRGATGTRPVFRRHRQPRFTRLRGDR